MTDTTHSDSTSSRLFGEDSVGHDPTTGTFHARFGAEPNTVVVTIVDTVATVTNRDPTTLSPLFEVINPEALAGLVTSSRETPVDVTFSYEGCQISVSNHGVTVEPPPE